MLAKAKKFGFGGLKVSTRLSGGLGILTVLAIGIGGIGWYSVRSIDTELTNISRVSGPTIEMTDDLNAGVWQSTKIAEEIASAHDLQELTELEEESARVIAAYDQTKSQLDSLVTDPVMQQYLDEALSVKKAYDGRVEALIEAQRRQIAERNSARESLMAFNRIDEELNIHLTEFAERNAVQMRKADNRGDDLAASGADGMAVNRVLSDLFENDYPVVEASLKLQALVNKSDSFARAYLAETDPAELVRIEEKFADFTDSIVPYIDVLDARVESEDGRRDLETLKADFTGWREQITGEAGLFNAHNARIQAQEELESALVALEDSADETIAMLDEISAVADDLSNESETNAETAVSQATMTILSLLAVVAFVAGGLILIVVRTVTNPIKAITRTMRQLADGDTSVAIPGSGRLDEIGDMAGAVQVFKDNALEKERLESEQKKAEERAEEQQRRAMQELADRFENEVGGIVEMVSSAATELQATSHQLSAAVEETEAQTSAAAAGADQASGSVQTVASAAEELASAIQEVNSQVSSAANKLQSTAQGARSAQLQMDELLKMVDQIDEVVEQISDVAEKTNLLALNATIESARAGEAGKGFAVVANEVKSLANQTRQMTDNIASQLAAVKEASKLAVDGTRSIVGEVETINETTGAIAASVEQQNATTSEISRSAQEAAKGTDAVSGNLGSVREAAGHTAEASSGVSQAANDLAEQAEGLKSAMQTFLSKVRTA